MGLKKYFEERVGTGDTEFEYGDTEYLLEVTWGTEQLSVIRALVLFRSWDGGGGEDSRQVYGEWGNNSSGAVGGGR